MSCVSAAYCVAAGHFNTSVSVTQTLIEVYSNGTWSIAQSSDTAATSSNAFYDVSCESPTSCVAGGYYEGQGGPQTLVETYDGTSWSIATIQNSTASHPSSVDAVTCVSASTCTAVGGAGGEALVLAGSASPPATFAIATALLPQAQANKSYSASILTMGGIAPYSFSLSSGSLPAGLTLSASGVVSGVPVKQGTFSFGVSVTDSASPPQSAEGSVSIIVSSLAAPGSGYRFVASDRGIFSFGNAPFYGSMGGKRLNAGIVGIAASVTG